MEMIDKLYMGKPVVILSLLDEIGDCIHNFRNGFVVMLPAIEVETLEIQEQLIHDLMNDGCMEFCCIGPHAENLNDLIDKIIEEQECYTIVTTWYDDLTEGCDYFLNAAGGGEYPRLWLVKDYKQITSIIQSILND
jgi:hypothetical protein